MPNIVTHITIAHEVTASNHPDLLLGSTLPDFMGMYRDYFGVRLGADVFEHSAEAMEGIVLHHQTDKAYDGLEALRDLRVGMRRDLVEGVPGLGRAAVRVCADMATDIFVDSAIMSSTRTEALFEAVTSALEGQETRIQEISDRDFIEMLEAFFIMNRPYRYNNPVNVANIISSRLAARGEHRQTRLTIPDDEATVSAVADVLGANMGRVRSVASTMVADTVEILTAQRA